MQMLVLVSQFERLFQLSAPLFSGSPLSSTDAAQTVPLFARSQGRNWKTQAHDTRITCATPSVQLEFFSNPRSQAFFDDTAVTGTHMHNAGRPRVAEQKRTQHALHLEHRRATSRLCMLYQIYHGSIGIPHDPYILPYRHTPRPSRQTDMHTLATYQCRTNYFKCSLVSRLVGPYTPNSPSLG